MLHFIHSIETSFLLFLQSLRNPFLDLFFSFFSVIGNAGAIWFLTAFFLIPSKNFRHIGLLLLISISLCFLINNIIIKNLVQRPRPFYAINDLSPLFSGFWADSDSWSFPSGHTCSSFAAAFILSRSFSIFFINSNNPKLLIPYLAYIPAFLISFSRAYIGVHYPSDIIAAAFIGTLFPALFCFLSAFFRIPYLNPP